MSYVNYECTTCRRSKSFVKDNLRVTPDSCTITKGCLGRLIPTKETAQPTATKAVNGVEEWYARGVTHAKAGAVSVTPNFTLSTSATGSLVLAVRSDSPTALPTQLTISLEQKRVGDVAYQQYQFKPSASTTLISGKDSVGKNLRFDQLAIDEGRITVRVNGVDTTDFLLEPSRITFRTQIFAGAIVDIIIYTEKSTTTRTLTLTRNKTLLPSLTRGSWSNIDYVVQAEANGGTSKWYLYSTDVIAGLTAGKIRVVKNDVSDEAFFLLASTPYQSTDRYLNFVVDQSILSDDFNTAHDSGRLTASQALLSELFPPLMLVPEAYISTDLFTVGSSSAVVTDTEEARFASKKILGPV
jgi:hypothetical protein